MKYNKKNAKEYAFQNMTGIWAAALNPFSEDFSLDENGLRSNLRHWIDDLEIDGFFYFRKAGRIFLDVFGREKKKLFNSS
jgi:4-hydroxy-tetrahydrodipicolinate synthase